MNDDLQQSIGYILKSIAFYIAVLAFKELVKFIYPYFEPPPWFQQQSGYSTSQPQSRRS